MAQATAYEQFMLELVNAERAKVGAQPLAFNSYLNDSADSHTNWMINTDTFSHTGVGGSSPTTRMKTAGYTFSGSWASAENIAWASTRAPSGYQDEVQLLHTNFMNSAGHKANILNANFREIGIGFNTGAYQKWDAAFATQNFALSGSKVFLTGVALDDRDGDRFYDVGEALSGLTVTAVSSTGAKYTATTQTAGGYSLALATGTYKVTFSGGGITPVTKQVTIGSKNVKVDLVDPVVATASATSAAPSTETTTASTETTTAPTATKTIRGTTGNDKLSGTASAETFRGSAGNDEIYGKSGNDKLIGGSGNDFLSGGKGEDVFRFVGKWGKDKVLDFRDGVDHIDLRGNSLDFGDLSIAKIDADRDGVVDDVIIKAHDQSITLMNTKAALINAADFVF